MSCALSWDGAAGEAGRSNIFSKNERSSVTAALNTLRVDSAARGEDAAATRALPRRAVCIRGSKRNASGRRTGSGTVSATRAAVGGAGRAAKAGAGTSAAGRAARVAAGSAAAGTGTTVRGAARVKPRLAVWRTGAGSSIQARAAA